MEAKVKRRRKKKYPCPNPLFEKWLTEWKQEAADKGSRLQFTYAKALSSLRKYPLPLSCGREAKILENFGDKICAKLDLKLSEWKQMSSALNGSQTSSTSSTCSSSSTSGNVASPVQSKMTKPKQSLASKGAVEVVTVSKGRVNTVQRTAPTSDVVEKVTLDNAYLIEDDCFYLLPGHFSILLCVDNCETLSGHGSKKKLFLTELQKCGIEFDVRKLHVGDFLWVARDISDSSRELVLNFIIERKRLDDLAHSIKDGRFREQKFRMKNCGLKNPIYLVENCNGVKYCGLPESTLEQAIVNTQIIDGFQVKRTQGVKESVTYLSLLTRIIKNKYQRQTLVSASRDILQKNSYSSNAFMTFGEFNSSSVKNKSLTVKEMFAKHLLQFFGLSVDRAAAIVERFKTPSEFFEAYNRCSTVDEKIQMVASVKFGAYKKNIGPALSRSIHQFYCANDIFN